MSGSVGIPPDKMHFWPWNHGPMGAANIAVSDRSTVERSLEWLLKNTDDAKTAILEIASQYADQPQLGCLAINWLEGSHWPTHQEFADDFYWAAVNQLRTALRDDKRPCVVIQQIPDLQKPWIAVHETALEVLLFLTIPAVPL